MHTIYLCLVQQHDYGLVALAFVLCVLGCYAVFAVGIHAVMARDRRLSFLWGCVTLFATSCTIWATHYIGMLAYRVPFPSGFLPWPTIASFVVAVALCAVAGVILLRGHSRHASVVAGAVTGLAISAMHFTGMSAFRAVGTITWNWDLVAVAIVTGSTFGALAGLASWHRRTVGLWTPTGLLAMAICGDHFTILFRFWKCSQTKRRMPWLRGMVS